MPADSDQPFVPAAPSNEPQLPLEYREPQVPVQEEFPLRVRVRKRPPAPSVEEQLLGFDSAASGAPRTEYLRRNRQILLLRTLSTPLDKIALITDTKKPTIVWVVKMARRSHYDRLVVKHQPGRHGKRQEILAALRGGMPQGDVKQTFGIHRTTVLRALHQLQNSRTAA